MFPFIEITEQFKIPLYATIFMLGFFLAVILARKLAPSFCATKEDVTYAAAYAAIGILIGSKVVYFITKLPNIVVKYDTFFKIIKESPLYAMQYAFGGFVFYGGLIGAIAAVWIYCKQYKVPFAPLVDIYAPLIPFVHAFGRIACFCSGCCYGKEYHGPFAVQFPYNEQIPELSEVPRIPVQLIETCTNFIVFGVIFYLAKKKKLKSGQMMGIYLVYYSIARFFLEMLRGDELRGSISIFSTSQLISVLLLPIGIYLLSGKLENKSKGGLKDEM